MKYFLLPLFLFASCNQHELTKDQLIKVIKENPKEVMLALQSAAQEAQRESAKAQEAEEKRALEATFDKPLPVNIRSDEAILGAVDAPITLVEYSDFECSFCGRGFGTVQELLSRYPGKIRFIYKHLPLDFHPQAMISARYYEAIRLQDPMKAYAFHNELFKDQAKLRNGKPFLDKLALKVGANLKKLKGDLDSEKVSSRIEEDVQEAKTFGIQGTPGFVLNGIPVKGAYPTEHFVSIVDELKKRGKLNL